MPTPHALLLLILLAATALARPAPASAQRVRLGRVGLKLGGSLAQYRGEDAHGGNGNLGGYCGGVVLHLPVGSVFSVQPELLYSQKGAHSQYFVMPNHMTATGAQRLTYAELPILAKLRSHVGLFAEFGPTLSYLLSASINSSAPIGGQTSFDNRFQFNSFEWGYAAGVGYQDTKGLTLGVRYSGGLSPVFTADAFKGYYGNNEPRIYNQTFQLSVGYIFYGRPEAEFTQ